MADETNEGDVIQEGGAPVNDPSPSDNQGAFATTPPAAGGLLDGEGEGAAAKPEVEPSDGGEDWKLEAGDTGLEGEDLERLEKWAKTVGLSKEQTEKIRDQHAKERADLPQRMAQMDQEWRDELYADKEFGGQNWDKTVTNARKALKAYDPTGEAVELLRKTGYGSHPTLVKLLARIGADMGEDNILRTGSSGGEIPLEDRLYTKKAH